MSATEPLVRQAARVVLVDDRERVLLVHGRDPNRPDRPMWWITPGGGLDDGESAEQAARRELREETGLPLAPGELGRVILRRTVTFEFTGLLLEQHETFFLARIEAPADLETSGWNDIERQALSELRWWTLAELAATTETYFPTDLLQLLADNGIGVDR